MACCPDRVNWQLCLLLLQADVKRLGRLMRVLSIGACDEYLEGLKCHHIQHEHPHVRSALEEVAQAHIVLHKALDNGVISDAWGVIQHAFNLRQEIAVKRVSGVGSGLAVLHKESFQESGRRMLVLPLHFVTA